MQDAVPQDAVREDVVPEDVVLRDGSVVTIRPINELDVVDLEQFHEGLSAETIRLRFFTPHPHLSTTELERFSNVDHVEREALIALHDEAIVGIGRYDHIESSRVAEVAFVVADAWQGRGVASALLQRIRAFAVRSGVTVLEADTLGENQSMRHVLTRGGRTFQQSWDHGVVHLEIPIDIAQDNMDG